MTSRIGRIEALELEGKDEAHRLLVEVAKWVEPVMRQRDWTVPLLCERNFGHSGTLGMNINHGQRIELRLRTPADPRSLYPVEMVTDTMLHELSHIVHGNHSASFYELWEELRKELAGNVAKGLKGSGGGFDAIGFKLSNEGHNPSSLLEARRKAAAAAEARLRSSSLFGTAPQRVGGDATLQERGAAEAARIAAMRRCCEWCGNEGAVAAAPVAEDAPLLVEAGAPEPPVKRVATADAAVAVAAVPAWACELCTFLNESEERLCGACEVGLRPGLWRCPSCTAINASLFSCSVCEAQRRL